MLQTQEPSALHSKRHTFLYGNTKTQSVVFIIIASFLLRLSFMGTHDLMVEEAYYWNYSEHLDYGYLDHPPMVALLIKISTYIFGTNEFGVRFIGLIVWIGAAFYSYKLTNLMNRDAGLYAVIVLSTLPYFFFQSLVITPDVPMFLCWSAALYCLYQALVNHKAYYWYGSGMWVGLGLCSKYSIILLAPTAFIYMVSVPHARFWFRRREPYLCALITLLFFFPVIYWNATHEWASFIFQSTRRFKEVSKFSLHHFVGLVFLFLLPLGATGLCNLFYKKAGKSANITLQSLRFLQLFTLIPLGFFGIFSLTHTIKFDWIGPSLIALVPWLSLHILHSKRMRALWFKGSVFVLLVYGCILFCVTFQLPNTLAPYVLKELVGWNDMTMQAHEIAQEINKNTGKTPVFVPLDSYHIGSELAFYQAKLLKEGNIDQTYPILGRHVFGMESLMWRYWDNQQEQHDNTWILISSKRQDFENPNVKKHIHSESQIQTFWPHTSAKGHAIKPYYYAVVDVG
jgi:4-amino-4-deoxy-L-arabinose transferase-like glycosyltransferase